MNNHLKRYLAGFAVSLALTLFAYLLASRHVYGGEKLVAAVIGLAMVQAVVQLILFLHLDQESKPRWNFLVFISTVGVIFIIVAASIWIMNSLNYRHTSPDSQKLQDYIFQQEAIPK